MPTPTLTVLIGYPDPDRKSEGHVHIITPAGRRVSIPESAIEAKHVMEAGETGALRLFLRGDALICAEMRITDLSASETHWSSDTARRPRHGLHAAMSPDDGSTHWSSDTA